MVVGGVTVAGGVIGSGDVVFAGGVVGGGVVGGSVGAGVDGLSGGRAVLIDCCDGLHEIVNITVRPTNRRIPSTNRLIGIDFFTTSSFMSYHI